MKDHLVNEVMSQGNDRLQAWRSCMFVPDLRSPDLSRIPPARTSFLLCFLWLHYFFPFRYSREL